LTIGGGLCRRRDTVRFLFQFFASPLFLFRCYVDDSVPTTPPPLPFFSPSRDRCRPPAGATFFLKRSGVAPFYIESPFAVNVNTDAGSLNQLQNGDRGLMAASWILPKAQLYAEAPDLSTRRLQLFLSRASSPSPESGELEMIGFCGPCLRFPSVWKVSPFPLLCPPSLTPLFR